MQKLAEICIRRPVFAAMLILALVVVGAEAYYRLSVDRLPSVDLPIISVRASLPGASSEQMENSVTQVLEEAVNTVQGIDELRSITGPGSAIILITFNLNRDVEAAAQDVRDRVNATLRRLPRDVDPPVISKTDSDSEPILTVALTGEMNLRQLTELADKAVKQQLERSEGVGEVRVNGGLARTINIWADAKRLNAYNLPISAISDAIVRQNADVPGGNVTGAAREQSLRTMGQLADAHAFNEAVIARINGQPIKVKDIGHAEDGTAEQRSTSRLNGQPTVTLEVRRQSGANTVRVIEAAKAKLDQIAPQLPPGARLEVIRDQSRYIHAALHEINIHLVLGSILACLVVLAFMRSWRSTIIAGVAIPTSVIATFGMMWALDFTLNSVTMLALVLMVGVVIDDAIVVLENIFRFVEEKRMDSFTAARAATAEIGLAVLATTLSLVVIFIPVSFMSSISGRFLYQFGITAAVAVLVSLLVSFTLTPMMSARLLRGEAEKARRGADPHANAASRGGFYGYIDRAYAALLGLSMRHRLAVAALAALVIASIAPLYAVSRFEFTPSDVDEAEFSLRVDGPNGASLPAMNAAMQTVEADILATPGVETALITVGGGFLGDVSSGSGYIRIAPHEARTFGLGRLWRETLAGNPLNAFRGNYTQSDVMQALRAKLRKYKALRISLRNNASFNIGGGNYDIDFVIQGPELERLAQYTQTLRQKAKAIPGIVDADTTLKLDSPELRVQIDRERAADLGIDAQDIGAALRLMVGGDTKVSRFYDPATNEGYDVRLRLLPEDRNNPATLNRLYLAGGNGGDESTDKLIPLENVIRTESARTAGRIDRLNRQRSANVRAGVAPGYALGDRLDALQRAADEMNLPPAYTTLISGRGRELNRTYREFLWAFALSIVFMYMILASQFESLIHPLTILLSLPLAIPFALLSLWLTGGTLNLYSALGILVLFGVVKKNSILQIDHMNGLREKGMERGAAIMQANRDRLRPILMTTLALVAGMLPLALGTGPGAEERHAVAVVVIGGQTLSLLLTLLVTPVAYSLFDDLAARLRRLRVDPTGAITPTAGSPQDVWPPHPASPGVGAA